MKSKVDAICEYDVIVIGAGAVGCAVARELSRYDLSVAVLEKNSDVAGEISGRNSAVVHAGFNNKPGSLMASLCVEGNRGFGALCEALDVPFRQTGKLVVGFDDTDVQTLERLLQQGRANGCPDLEILRGAPLQKLLREHHMEEACGSTGPVAALWSPHTGITNPFLYCVALAENAQANGVKFFLDTEVTGIRRIDTDAAGSQGETGMRFAVETRGTLHCRYLINCAGLQADRIAAMAMGTASPYRIYPCRGEYFILDQSELSMPIYPAPRKGIGGLGVHLTPTMEGNILIGPSAEYLEEAHLEEEAPDEEPGYSGNSSQSVVEANETAGSGGFRDDYACTRPVMEQLMAEAVQLMPAIRDMQPIGNYSGIRPKLAPPGEGGYHDFVIRAEQVPGLINLIGIESPGLTASVPIARRVCRIIDALEGGRLSRKQDFREQRRGILRFRDQSPARQAQLIAEDPDYGEIVCRCQQITKREIRDAIENPLGARSISAIKYRAWATTGRCNGGYCLPRIAAMLVEDYGVDPAQVRHRDPGSELFTGRVK